MPSLVGLAVATAGAAASIGATRGTGPHRTKALVALSALPPAPPPAPRKASAPARSRSATGKLIAWPSSNGYTIVLDSIPLARGAQAARARALAAVKAGLRQVGVLASSSYPSLQPGYYIVFSGVYASLEEAQSALQDAKSSFPTAYARPIAR